jgi:phage I-like protein
MRQIQGLKNSSAFSQVILLNENVVPTEVQILRVGKFNHPSYGPFEITKITLKEMKDNFDKKIRGIDMAFDYYHASDEDASAWVEDLMLKEDDSELWAKVRWTPKAERKLAERELRYFSPDFAFKWTDPETGMTFNNVLFGGGLTNRPFVKEMAAIVASEKESAMSKEIELGGPGSGRTPGGGSGKANPERAAAKRMEALKKSREAQVAYSKRSAAIKSGQAAAKEAAKDRNWAAGLKQAKINAGLKPGKKTLDENQEKENITMDEKDKKIAELEAKIKELEAMLVPTDDEKMALEAQEKAAQYEEENKKMLAENATLKERAEKAEKAVEAAEKEKEFNVLLTEGKACAAQKDAFIKGNMTEFIKLAQPLNLKGSGSSLTPEPTDREAKVLKLAEEKMKENAKLSKADAISLALKEIK